MAEGRERELQHQGERRRKLQCQGERKREIWQSFNTKEKEGRSLSRASTPRRERHREIWQRGKRKSFNAKEKKT